MSPLQPPRFFEIFGAFDDGSLLLKEAEDREFALAPDPGKRDKFVLIDRASFVLQRHGQIITTRSIFEELFCKSGEGEKGQVPSPVAIPESNRVSENVARLIAHYMQLKARCALLQDAIAGTPDSAARFKLTLAALRGEMKDVAAALRKKVEAFDGFKLN